MGGAGLHLGRYFIGGLLAETWWVVLLRSLASLLFGVGLLAWPRPSVFALVWLFGAYAMLDGLAAVFLSVHSKGRRRPGWLALSGFISVAAGVFAFTRPRAMALTIVALMGAWLILRGASELISLRATYGDQARGFVQSSRRARRSAILNSVLSVAFGIGVVVAPRIGALGLLWAVGVWAIMHALLTALFALDLRRTSLDRTEPNASA